MLTLSSVYLTPPNITLKLGKVGKRRISCGDRIFCLKCFGVENFSRMCAGKSKKINNNSHMFGNKCRKKIKFKTKSFRFELLVQNEWEANAIKFI